jgi:hypothetical protein
LTRQLARVAARRHRTLDVQRLQAQQRA